jgi:signal transduction histidine kinase
VSETEPAVVLVVDDHDAGRFVKVQTLRRAGFVVHEFATGLSALAAVSSIGPDAVVLDVNLPDISGLEVCRRIREMPSALKSMQIIQVSNTAVSVADQVRGLDQGADVYLTEPIEGEVLVATVRALVRAHRAEAALAVALEHEREARNVAEEASRLKDEFIATLSHELRTPLNALMGWIWQLRNSTLDEGAQARALESLERNARVQAQLINDLLDISRISKGKLHLNMRVVDVKGVLDAAVDSVRDSAERKDLAVTVAAEAGLHVAGDHARLQQVVTNLLTNAVQFTPQHGRIDVAAAARGEDVAIEVSDTGEGIEPAFLPHVFDQFRQGEGGLSRMHGGLGLGLSVVRQLIELHGGRVAVTSGGRGQGTTFTFILPREAPDHDGDASSPVLSGMHVLVVHPVAGELAEILEASGAETTAVAATDGAGPPAGTFDAIVADQAHLAGAPANVPVVLIDRALSGGELVRRVMRARRGVRSR